MRLTAKLVLIVFVAVAALTTATAFFTIRQQFASFQAGREQLARELREQFSDPLLKAWEADGREGVDDELGTMQVEVRRTELRWVQFNVAEGHPDAPMIPADSLQRVRQGKIESVVIKHRGGEERLHTLFQVAGSSGNPVGVELSDSLNPVNEQTRQTIGVTLMTLAGLALICLAIVIVAGVRVVGRPLERLVAKTKRIAAGDFSHPIQIPGQDELSRLGDALNEMSDQLQAQKETIESETASRIAALGQLRHADRLKTVGRLAAGIAHELGTPLNVVSGRAGLIADGGLSEADVRHSAEAIKSEADRMTQIIRQLLDFARRSNTDRQSIDLRGVVTRTVELLTTMAHKKCIQLVVSKMPDAIHAKIDPAQFQQVLTNIIVNAIQSTPESGSVEVMLSACEAHSPEEDRAGPYACIEIRDDGVGIAADDLEHIFEPFFTTKDVGEGTGLGLSIAYGIVQEHGGWIDVQSEPGRGTRFTIYLPREEAA